MITSGTAGFHLSFDLDAGDFDGDGDNDLVTANNNGKSAGVLLGDGSGGFTSPIQG